MRTRTSFSVGISATLILLTNGLFASPIAYEPSLYTFLSVSDVGYFGSINNLGEIAFENMAAAPGSSPLYSTVRGQLTNLPSSNQARFPSINDAGEVVYQGLQPSGTGHWTVWSTARGQIGYGGLPGINNDGEVSYEAGQFSPPTIKSSVRGTLVTLSPSDSPGHTDINDAGEVVFSNIGNGHRQILSTTRGLLVANAGGSATLNDYGDVLYTSATADTDLNAVYSIDGTRLTNFTGITPSIWVGGFIDMNDYGDFVFDIFSQVDHRLVLATQRPEYYTQFGTFDPSSLKIPEDGYSTMSLLLLGFTFTLGVANRIGWACKAGHV